MNLSIKDFGIRWGIIVGLFCVIGVLLLYLMGISWFAGWFRFAPSVVYYVIFLLAALQWRKAKGGFISFKEVFFGLLISSAIATIMLMLFNYLLYTVIDPTLSDQVKKYWMDWTFNFMNGKAPESKVQETMQQMEDKDWSMSIKNLAISIPITIGLDCIFILIIAAIAKRSNPITKMELENPAPTI